MVALTDTLAVMRNARNTSVKEKNMSGRKSWKSAKRHERRTTMTASSIGGNLMADEIMTAPEEDQELFQLSNGRYIMDEAQSRVMFQIKEAVDIHHKMC